MQPASAKWCDRRDYVFIEFCDVNVNFEKSNLTFSCLGESDNFKHLNEIDLFYCIDTNDSKHKRMDRSILCCLQTGESGQLWPKLTKERAKLNCLNWEDGSDEDRSNFDTNDDSQDSDDEKCQIWSKKYCHHLDFEKENNFSPRFHN
uniref:Prostaglandin E synthase 3 n=1 Tax=Cercocebus atys TaxID=9531 RepID=A0A2K5LE34_CERAT